ncbi:MAG: 30S ribosomal protein S4e [Methanomicrobiales archaeon]|nr:30S ribosomal protein S4e [Methanomicrobiales archaeon]
MGDHQKRLTAPDSWGIAKKKKKFVAKTAPGPHNRNAMPIAIWLRDQMGLAKDMKEVRQILNQKDVILNGRICRDPNLGIGVFDVISIPRIGKHFTILLNEHGKIVAKEISEERSGLRLCKVRDRNFLKGGKVQVNLLYGANLLTDKQVKPNDSIVLTLGSPLDSSKKRFELLDHYPCEAGNYAMVIGGTHSGKVGKIVAVEKRPGNTPNRVILEDEAAKTRFETIEKYIFMVGRTAEETARWGAKR